VPPVPYAFNSLLALLFDALTGDPGWLYRRVPHPAVLLGRLIAIGERRWNQARLGPRASYLRGTALTFALIALAALLAWLIATVLATLPGGGYVEALLASTLIAARGLFQHVRAVATALERDLDAGRAAVARIVGRDPESLDGAGVARAALESLAENFSDGVVAPLLWYALLGLPGLAAYKAINTLDSMIGHRDPRHIHFGRAAARIDDLANWLPARIAGLLLCVAALPLRDASPRAAFAALRRDAPRHRSPNAGWQEAALAGALDMRLAGPRHYAATLVNDAWMGVGRTDLTAADVHRGLRLYLSANALLAALLAGAAVI